MNSSETSSDVIARLDEAVDDFEPIIRFTAFGESNVEFVTVTQATDRTASFVVKHEIVKRLRAAFEREGIAINYPVLRLIRDGGEPNGWIEDDKPLLP